MIPVHSPLLREYSRLFKEMDDLYHELARRAGLSDSAFDILYTLCMKGDGCLQKDICEFSSISKQTINSSVRRRCLDIDYEIPGQEGLIRLSSGKGRDTHIFLTDTGRAMVREKILPVAQMEERAFAQLHPRQQQELLSLTREYVFGFKKLTDSLP